MADDYETRPPANMNMYPVVDRRVRTSRPVIDASLSVHDTAVDLLIRERLSESLPESLMQYPVLRLQSTVKIHRP